MPRIVKQPKLLYEVVKESIRDALIVPLLKRGGQLPSDRALAAEYEVNVGTINKAIHELAREGYVERRVGAGTFVVPQRAGRPAMGIYFGGLVLDGTRENAIYGKLNQALQELIAEAGRTVRHYVDVRIAAFQGEPLPGLIDDVNSSRLTSLLVARASPTEYEWLRRLPIPVVGNGIEVGGASVRYGIRKGARRAAKHLLDAGCRRLAVICPTPPGEAAPDAEPPPIWQGVQDASQLSPRVQEVTWAEVGPGLGSSGERVPDEERGYDAFERLWRARQRPDGIVVFTDIFALGVVRAARERGVSLGKKVKVVAFTNEENPWPELEHLPQMRLSVRKVAEALLGLAVRIERGEKAEDVEVPLRFDAGEAGDAR